MKRIIKYLRLIFSMPFLWTCLSLNLAPTTNWKTLIFPPSDNFERIILEATYEKTINVEMQEYEMAISLKNKNYPNALLIYFSSEVLFRGLNTITRRFSFYPNTLSEGENLITLSMSCSTSNDVLAIPTYLKTHETFNPATLVNGVYESPKNDISLINGLLTLKGDTIYFYNFDLFAEDEFYSYFKLNRFKFIYDGNFIYQNVYLLIKDEYSYYQRISKYLNSDFRQIPLLIKVDKEGFYYFTFKNKLYVEPDTYLMSPIKLFGFLETKNFYFPKERFHNQQNLEMSIVIENCGINDLTIKYDFTYYSHLNFIGNCQDSKYCINVSSPQTNVEESDFEEIILC
ncbi:MAG: hypothetical protein GX132_00470 [Erysipelotrichia bacterium]|nr:hypothetical protein [Erysipelotrichia bacterium]